jgi:hypothetical protein
VPDRKDPPLAAFVHINEEQRRFGANQFPRFVRPKVFGWLWLLIFGLLLGLAFVFTVYLRSPA